MKRREFIKKAIGSLGYVCMGLTSMFIGKSRLPHISWEDVPHMPSVKPPKPDNVFGKGSISFVGIDDYIEVSEKDVELQGDFTLSVWHHFVCNRVGDIEEMYIDGKKVDDIAVSSLIHCILNFRREQVGVLVEEEFWFRRKV